VSCPLISEGKVNSPSILRKLFFPKYQCRLTNKSTNKSYCGCCAASCSRAAVSSCFWFFAASFAAFAFSFAAFSSCFCRRFCAFISDLVIGAVASLVLVVEEVAVEGVVLVVVVVDVCALTRMGCSIRRPSNR
jgi:hypothetical protein